MSHWFQNGRPIEAISIDDRSVQYGDGVFETIAIRDGRPRLWDLHVQRLQAGCDRIGIDVPAANLLYHDLLTALSRTTTDTRYATAKILVTAGDGPRGYVRSPASSSNVLMGTFESTPLPRHRYSKGVDTIVCETRASVHSRLGGIKSLNRLEQVMARREWSSDAYFEGLMLDPDENLVCGTMCNVFTVHGNALSTPRTDRSGITGIMRQHILSLLEANDIACNERPLSVDDVLGADEVFLCNSQIGAVPVRSVAGAQLGAGDVARTVMMMLVYNGVPECEP